MSSLGNLYYTLSLKDETDAAIQRINTKLKELGSDFYITPKLAKSLEEVLPKGIGIDITPNKVEQEKLDAAIQGKVMHAEVLPLADKLKTAVTDALRSVPVQFDNVTLPPDKISSAITQALAKTDFSTVGDEAAKAIKVKVEGQTYYVKVTAKTEDLKSAVTKALEVIERKEHKIKFDKSSIKTFKDELTAAIGEKIKVTPQLNLSQQQIDSAVQGKVMRIEVMPLLTNLRKAIKDAFAANPAEIEIGPNSATLRNTINRVCQAQGYMVNISTVTGLEHQIRTITNNKVYDVKLTVDPRVLAQSLQNAMANFQSKQFGLTVAQDVLRKSIDAALQVKPFEIQIKVMQNQARQAVQNALNGASNITSADALKYQRLMTGELKAAQAELARLRASQMSARDAANAHASASINLGGALGSNIKIAGELGSAMASLYSIHAARQFIGQITEIGGELEHQKIALETIYGSGSKMETLYSHIKGLARESPFGVIELSKNIKQLSAYGVAYNEVYDTAKRLADISAATSVDIQRLILAFGKTKNRTFLDGLEAKQFAYANIPIYDALSKKLTELEGKFVSVKDVMGRIKKREIGFDMVKEILWDMTDEGGKFYNMQEKLAGSIKTSFKLIKDNIDLMFGEIAESAVGDQIKGFYVFLQKLTKEWKTMAAAMATGVVALGIYKTATMAMNAVMGKSLVMGAKQHASLKMERYHANLAAQSYRNLTQAEEENYLASAGLAKIKGINLLRSKQLSAAEAEALYAKKLLTREDVLRLVALRKLSVASAQYVLTTKGMTAADIAEMNAQIARAAAAKRSTVIMKQLHASTMAVIGSMKSFILASLPMAALGAMLTIWQRNAEEAQKAKDIADGLFSKAVDSAKELKGIIGEIGSSEGLSDLELGQGIERMENAVKDLSPTPVKDINDSLVAQDGHVRTLAERFDFLKGRIEQLRDAYQMAVDKNFSDKIEGSLRATDGSNWFTKFFNDDIITNAKDYTNALKRREDAITRYVTNNKKELNDLLTFITGRDQEFAKATAEMTSYEDKLRELISFSDGKYLQTSLLGGGTLAGLGNVKQINAAYDELIADTDKFIADLNTRLRLNPLTMTDEQKTALTMSLKHILDSMEGAGEDAKAVIAKKWEEAWNIVIMEDKIGPSMRAKFKNLVEDSSDEGVEAIRKKLVYEGFDKLDKEGQKKAREIMEKAKGQAMNELSLTNQQMADYLASHPLEQLIQLVYTDSNNAPSELAKELVAKHGYPGLTSSTDRLVRQWTKSGKMYESRNAAKESLQAVYSELEAAKREGGEVQKKAQDAYNEVWNALQYLGWTDLETKDQKSNKHTGTKSQKDLFADAIKERIKILKEAKKEYEDLAKSIGREASFDELKDSPIFEGLKANEYLPEQSIPKTIEDYKKSLDELQEKLAAKGLQTQKHRELNIEIEKIKFEIKKKEIEESIKTALDEVSREAERQLADWNLFDKVRQATGNKDLAMSVAFGLNADAETDYPTLVKKQFSDIAKALGHDITFDNTTLAQAKALGDDIAKAYENTAKDLEKYAREQKDAIADILSEYQSLQDKLAKIDADRERKLKTVREADLPDTERAKLTQRINVEADYQKFQQSNDYLRFFSGIYSLTMDKAQQIGDKIRYHLNEQLQAGRLSAEDYYKEIERINQQLTKLRNVKSDALTFMTSGVKGLQDKRLDKADSDILAQMTKVKDAEEALAKAKAEGNAADIVAANNALKLAKDGLKTYEAIRDAIVKDQEAWQKVADVTGIIANIAGGVSDAFNTLRDMADSFGFDTDSNAWNTAAAVVDTLTTVTSGVNKVVQSLMSGDIGGVIAGAFDTLLTPFTIWNKLHDKKLDKMIEKSKEAAQIMQNQYDILEKRMQNFLGNAAGMKTGVKGGAYAKQFQLMKGQLAELEKQRQAEIDKKKTDDSVVEDYNQQIEEMKVAINDFAIEAANAVYGIDLNGWAEQLGDALVDAFAAGEDAAEAFDRTVGDIMRDVTSKMISQDLLAPMFGDLRDYLFGKDGKAGVYNDDWVLDAGDMAGMKEYLDLIREKGIPQAQALFDAINEATGGVLNDTDNAKSGLSAGIQSITEDTADLLASYLNSVRADTSIIRMNWDELLKSALPQMNIIAEAQLTAQRQIAENTLRNAVAAEMIVQYSKSIDDRLRKAQADRSTGFWMK